MFILDPRFRKDVRPPYVMPDPDRASRAKNPYFGRALRSRKTVFMFPGSKAFARMTAPPLCHARPRSGIQGKESLFWWGVDVPKKRNY